MKLLTTYRALLWVLVGTLLCTLFAFKQLERRTLRQNVFLQAENARLRHENQLLVHVLIRNTQQAPQTARNLVRHADGTVKSVVYLGK